jgi:hypothetical protein
MGGGHSSPFHWFVQIFIPPPPPDPCASDKNVYNNNKYPVIPNKQGEKGSAEQERNTSINTENTAKSRVDDINKDINKPLNEKVPDIEDIKIEIVHKEAFCNNYWRDQITGQNNTINGLNSDITKLINEKRQHEINTKNYNDQYNDLSNNINSNNLYDAKRNIYIDQSKRPTNVPINNFHMNDNTYHDPTSDNLFYDKKLNNYDKTSNHIIMGGLDIPIVVENFTEGYENPKIYTGGYLAQINAYKNQYNNYYYAYNKSINLIQNNLQPQIDYLKLSELTGLQYAYTSVKTENDLIKQQIQENTDNYSTDNKQFVYQTDNLIYLKSVNFVIFIIYYSAFLIFFFFVIFMKPTMNIRIKIGLILIFLLYPFIIKPIEEFFYFVITFLISTIFGNVYVIN